MTLCGYLRNTQHETDVLIESCEKDLIQKIKEINPDVLGFSVMSNDHKWLLKTIVKIKMEFPNKMILVGGAHGAQYPDIIHKEDIDAVCVGEGEKPLKLFLDKLQNGEDYWNTRSFYVRYQGRVYKNDIMPLLENIDEAIEDREVYLKRYPFFKKDDLLQCLSSRGCPFKCTFCINERLHELYKGKGKLFRKKSINALMLELKNTIKQMPYAKRIFFADDLFLSDKKHFKEFAFRYKEEINLPYMIGGFPFFIDDEIGKLLKFSGCRMFAAGIETGNEEKRKRIFNKNIKNSDFIKMSRILKNNGVDLYTANIFNFPSETFEDALKTIEFNHELKTSHPAKSLLLPYPNTKIADIAKKMKVLPQDFGFEDIPQSYYLDSVIESPERDKILLLYSFFYFLCRNKKLFNLVKNNPWILKVIPFPKFWNYVGIFLWFRRWKGFNYINALSYLLRFRKNK